MYPITLSLQQRLALVDTLSPDPPVRDRARLMRRDHALRKYVGMTSPDETNETEAIIASLREGCWS